MSRIQTYANALHETINKAKQFYLNYVAPHNLMFVVLRLHLLFDISQTLAKFHYSKLSLSVFIETTKMSRLD